MAQTPKKTAKKTDAKSKAGDDVQPLTLQQGLANLGKAMVNLAMFPSRPVAKTLVDRVQAAIEDLDRVAPVGEGVVSAAQLQAMVDTAVAEAVAEKLPELVAAEVAKAIPEPELRISGTVGDEGDQPELIRDQA